MTGEINPCMYIVLLPSYLFLQFRISVSVLASVISNQSSYLHLSARANGTKPSPFGSRLKTGAGAEARGHTRIERGSSEKDCVVDTSHLQVSLFIGEAAVARRSIVDYFTVLVDIFREDSCNDTRVVGPVIHWCDDLPRYRLGAAPGSLKGTGQHCDLICEYWSLHRVCPKNDGTCQRRCSLRFD